MTDKLEQEPNNEAVGKLIGWGDVYDYPNKHNMIVALDKELPAGAKLYTSPPNAKAIEAATLMKAIEVIKGHAEAHSSKVGWHLVSRLDGDIRGLAYADAIQSLIDQ